MAASVHPEVVRSKAEHGVADGAAEHRQVAAIQRTRLLAAAVASVNELGYGRVTVGDITARARVSRRTFYELFTSREDCLAAVLESAVQALTRELARAGLERLAWRERVRRGLWVVLSFFEREPGLARVCVIGVLGGDRAVLERRGQLLGMLAGVVDEGRREGPRGGACTPLTAEGLVGAAFAIVYGRLLAAPSTRAAEADVLGAPLRGLIGELMALIVLPYLGPAAARRELARPAPASVVPEPEIAAQAGSDPLEGVEMRLTYRTAKVLEAVAECPGANNRQVARRAGIQDQGQVSKLLARLQRLGLLANASAGHAKGEPNAWSLTGKGQRVVQRINTHAIARTAAHGKERGERRAVCI